MSITDELREWAKAFTHWWYDPVKDEYTYTTGTMPPLIDAIRLDSNIIAIADRIDAEHQKAIRELNNLADASVLLPVDADGEIIHVGDMMGRGEARGHVIALMLSEYPRKWGGGLHWGVQLEGEQAPTALDGFFHHCHKPTVEDVLREFAERYLDYEGIPSAGRRGVGEALMDEYASKLRLAEMEDA